MPPPSSRSPDTEAPPHVTAALVAEASAWLAVLHGPERTPQVESGFAEWIRRHPAHARAFEEATDIWEEASNLTQLERLRSQAPVDAATPRPRSRWRSPADGQLEPTAASRRGSAAPVRRRRPILGAVALVILCLAAGAVFHLLWKPSISTQVGEQRVLVLDDGSRVVLNTDTRVVVDYGRHARSVELKHGEALFEVARRPNWPFIVDAGDRQVIALGTAFAVRREGQQVAVTLVEGKVTVMGGEGLSDAQAIIPGDDKNAEADRQEGASYARTLQPPLPPVRPPVVLAPGERVVFAATGPPRRDRPQLQSLLAWQRREIALDNTALEDAIAEMNRYSRIPLVAALDGDAEIRVTGLFRAGDSQSFARAVAETYRLRVEETPQAIRLTGTPARHSHLR